MNTSENPELIDELASRLIDGDVDLGDVDPAWRESVSQRAAELRVVRDLVRRAPIHSPSDTDEVVARVLAETRPRRRVAVYVSGLAAAAAVATIIGVAVSSSRDSRSDVIAGEATADDDAMVSTKVAPADMAPLSAAPESDAGVAESLAPPAAESAADGTPMTATVAGDACTDDLRPTIIPVAVIDGETVEIHWSAEHGVVVYRVSDCSVVLATTP
jgi:hypothetical protein